MRSVNADFNSNVRYYLYTFLVYINHIKFSEARGSVKLQLFQVLDKIYQRRVLLCIEQGYLFNTRPLSQVQFDYSLPEMLGTRSALDFVVNVGLFAYA